MLLAIDIGGTAVKIALSDWNGNLFKQTQAPSGFDHPQIPILEHILSVARSFVGEMNVEGVAISATGQVDTRSGTIIGGVNRTPHYDGEPIGRIFSEAFNAPTHVINDANAAVLGERWRGAAQNKNDVIMITLGTGIGGGIITGGQLLHGRRGIGGEIGHFPLLYGHGACACGLDGCYEKYASTTALIMQARQITGEDNLDGKIIFNRAKAGDEAMRTALTIWHQYVAAGIEGLVHIFNPELVLLGGGVSVQEELLITPVRNLVTKHVMPNFAEGLEIRAASLLNSAGLLGAIRFFLDEEG